MVYVFGLKRSRHKAVPANIEKIFDELINKPFIVLPDTSYNKKLGVYGSELRKMGLLHVSTDFLSNEPVAYLKINNYIKPGSIVKKSGKRVEYIFENLFIPNIKIKL